MSVTKGCAANGPRQRPPLLTPGAVNPRCAAAPARWTPRAESEVSISIPIKRATVTARIRHGWPEELARTAPVGFRFCTKPAHNALPADITDEVIIRYTQVEDNGCWMWLGFKDRHGYGWYRREKAHRVVYEHFFGPIPLNLVSDHLCRNKGCVNPGHIEPVPSRENTIRGIVFQTLKTHCKRGHPLSGDNARIRGTLRVCRTCARHSTRRSAERRSAEKRR
jgi:hypothetical protein